MSSRAQNLSLPGLDGERDLSKSQWYTPPWLAEKMWEWWLLNWLSNRSSGTGIHVLEPSAGNGSLLRPVLGSHRAQRVHAVELDARNVALLQQLSDPNKVLDVRQANFLDEPALGPVDVALLNPPYEDGQDVDFIIRALAWAPTVVGVFRSALVHSDDRYEHLWRYVDITRGKWLRARPGFGTGEKSDSARSDFVVLEMVLRDENRRVGEDMNCSFGWW